MTVFEFDDVVVDPAGFRIARAGRPLPIEPKALAVLLVLLNRAGDLVSKHQLLNEVWSGTFVTDNALTRVVADLRRALGDTAKTPKYIETVHTRGYRFIARLRNVFESPSAVSAAVRHPSPLRLSRLRSRVTPLIGRDADLRTIEEGCSVSRLLTLVGPGGVGKTQLALEHARRVAARYSDGICFVDLAACGSGTDVGTVISALLDLSDADERDSVERLTHALRPRQLLLVLDNCEHLVAGCARVAASLLHGCPDVSILATSQRPFGTAGESLVDVQPLAVPPPPAADRRIEFSEFATVPSVRLFVDRAKAVRSSFALTPANAAAVGEICRRLDGLPLAIELAAARIAVLSVDDIVQRLDDRLTLLSGGRSTLARHQTLVAVMDWSHALLTPAERMFLARLSVFAGGWSIEAAEAICTDSDVPREHILELTSSLVHKSLVVVYAAGEMVRYRLLETIRLYANLELQRCGQHDALRSRHFRYFLRLARAADRSLAGPAQSTWLDRLDREQGNLMAALGWAASAASRGVNPLALAIALRRFWCYRSRYLDARHWLTRSLDASPHSPARMRADALFALAVAEYGLSCWPAARAKVVDGLSLLSPGHRRARAFGLSVLASVATDARQAARAEREALQLARATNDTWLIGYAHIAAGLRAAREQRHRRSADSFTSAVRYLEQTGDRWLVKFASAYEGLQRYALGDRRRATLLAARALTIAAELQDRRAIAACLELFGYLAVSRRAFDLAARLFGAADNWRQTTGVPLSPSWSRLHERARTTLTRRFPSARETWQAGRLTPLDALMAEATRRLHVRLG